MTQVQDMSDQQINRALAELMGYSVKRSNSKFRLHLPDNTSGWTYGSEEAAWNDCPDFCNDPAASLEVQAAAIEADYPQYLMHIGTIVGGDGFKRILLASPRERAMAAYQVLKDHTASAFG